MSLAVQQFERRLAERTGINVTDLALLLTLDAAGEPLSAGALSQASGLTTGATTTAIDRLVKAGVAERRRSEQDRRAVMVALVRPGAQRILRLMESLLGSRLALWSEFSASERKTIMRFIKRNIDLVAEWSPPA